MSLAVLQLAQVAQAAAAIEDEARVAGASEGPGSVALDGLRGYVTFTGTGYFAWLVTVSGEYRWDHFAVSASVGGGQNYHLFADPNMLGGAVMVHGFAGSAKALEVAAGWSEYWADSSVQSVPALNVGYRAEDTASGLLFRVGLGLEMASFGVYISLGVGPKL